MYERNSDLCATQKKITENYAKKIKYTTLKTFPA